MLNTSIQLILNCNQLANMMTQQKNSDAEFNLLRTYYKTFEEEVKTNEEVLEQYINCLASLRTKIMMNRKDPRMFQIKEMQEVKDIIKNLFDDIKSNIQIEHSHAFNILKIIRHQREEFSKLNKMATQEYHKNCHQISKLQNYLQVKSDELTKLELEIEDKENQSTRRHSIDQYYIKSLNEPLKHMLSNDNYGEERIKFIKDVQQKIQFQLHHLEKQNVVFLQNINQTLKHCKQTIINNFKKLERIEESCLEENVHAFKINKPPSEDCTKTLKICPEVEKRQEINGKYVRKEELLEEFVFSPEDIALFKKNFNSLEDDDDSSQSGTSCNYQQSTMDPFEIESSKKVKSSPIE